MSRFLRVFAMALGLSPFAYLIASGFASLAYPTTAEMAKRVTIVVNSGTAASILFLAGVLIYRFARQRDSSAFFSGRKWFTICALPLLTFFPIGVVAGGAAILYFTLARPRHSRNLETISK